LWTVAVGINTVFIDDFNADWGVIAASSVIAATPIAVLFIFFPKANYWWINRRVCKRINPII
jgi:ABC-type maltose transport system permease subunit